MKAYLLFLVLAGCCCKSYAQADLLLSPKEKVVARMHSAYKSWEFNKQSEEFTDGVSYDRYEYSPKIQSAGDLTILFDKNEICISVMYYNNKAKLSEIVDNQHYILSGKNTWADRKTGSTIQATLKENPGSPIATLEFIHLGYKPAL